MITIFTPSFADEPNTNAQNLTVKEVVSRLPSDRFRVIMLAEGAPDRRLASRPNTQFLSATRHGNTLRWLTHLLRARPDIYFFPREGPLDKSFLFLQRQQRLPTALVTYVVMALDGIAMTTAMTRCIRHANCVIGNSLHVSQTITDRFGLKAQTIYDGIDATLFHPSAEPAESSRLTVLYAGSLQARKRVDLVIREAAKCPDAAFHLAGKGEEEASCRALVSKLACKNVTFLGHLSQSALAEEMRRADVFLFPSVLEGHPQVLGQAAASGLPAIAMALYRPDYVVHGETGYLVESDVDLSEKLRLLLSDAQLRSRMSAAAFRHSLKFDWGRVAKDWERVFLGVVPGNRHSG